MSSVDEVAIGKGVESTDDLCGNPVLGSDGSECITWLHHIGCRRKRGRGRGDGDDRRRGIWSVRWLWGRFGKLRWGWTTAGCHEQDDRQLTNQ